MAPEVSIVICTRDGAARLPQALKSLNDLEYSAGSVEVLVVDNGSRDKTAEVVQHAQQESPHRVRYVYEGRPGLSVARNRGIALAAGKIVAFIDDDATVARCWLNGLSQVFESSLKPTAVVGPIRPRMPINLPYWFPRCLLSHLSLLDRGSKVHRMKYPHYGFGTNMAFRREALRELKGFDVKLGRTPPTPFGTGEETDLFFRLEGIGGCILYTPNAYVWHSVPPERLNPSWLMRQTYWIGRASGQMEKKGLPRHNIALKMILAAMTIFIGLSTLPLACLSCNKRLRVIACCIVLNRWGYLNTVLCKP